MKCETCMFWSKSNFKSMEPSPIDGRRHEGECRKNSPVQVNFSDGRAYTAWPSTDSNDWCGEWWPVEYDEPTSVPMTGGMRHDD